MKTTITDISEIKRSQKYQEIYKDLADKLRALPTGKALECESPKIGYNLSVWGQTTKRTLACKYNLPIEYSSSNGKIYFWRKQ